MVMSVRNIERTRALQALDQMLQAFEAKDIQMMLWKQITLQKLEKRVGADWWIFHIKPKAEKAFSELQRYIEEVDSRSDKADLDNYAGCCHPLIHGEVKKA